MSLMMDDKKDTNSIFDRIEGLKAVDPKVLEAFMEAMTKKVIPQAAEAVEERRLLAVESGQWQLKC